jgi:Hint domain
MTSSDTVIEFDQFRRMRRALSDVIRRPAPERTQYKITDWYLPGFTGKARVSTTFGELPIEALRRGDDLRTYSGATVKVQMVDKIHLDEDFIRHHPRALPIRIPANSFGPGKPTNDLFVSPGQEICPDLHIASTFYKARDLPGSFTLDLSQSTGLTYYRFHCGQPTIVRVEGTWIRVQP